MDMSSLMAIAHERALTADELAVMNNNDVGLSATLGVRWTHVSKDSVRCVLHVGSRHLQPAGLVNGGVYCSIGESAGSIAGMAAAGKPVVGVNNSTDFISSVRSGVIEAEATPLQLGRRTQLWVVEMTHKGKLMARTTLRTMVIAEQS